MRVKCLSQPGIGPRPFDPESGPPRSSYTCFLFKVRNEFYKDTQGAMLVYDVANRESFDALDSWLEEIKKDIGSPADLEAVSFAVCANKVGHK